MIKFLRFFVFRVFVCVYLVCVFVWLRACVVLALGFLNATMFPVRVRVSILRLGFVFCFCWRTEVGVSLPMLEPAATFAPFGVSLHVCIYVDILGLCSYMHACSQHLRVLLTVHRRS